MTHLTASQLRDNVGGALQRVANDRERIVLCRNKRDMAAIVSLEDLALLEEIEMRRDLQAYRRAKKAFEESGEAAIPWDQAKKELGLE